MKRLGRMAIALGIVTSSLALVPTPAEAACVPTPSGTTCVDPTGACLIAVYPRVGPATCLKNPIGPIIDPRTQIEPN